ncbi:MAG: DUF3180 domain-containing protein [Propionibacteriaceae bacterium]|jgi:hypothetical protein|nr:DUF3180 domain-containing protein [Propionibacteriaceae bacterium]
MSKPTITLTRITVLIGAFVISLLFIWLLFLGLDSAGLTLPFVPIVVPIVLAVIAAAVGIGAYVTYRELNVKKERMLSHTALQRLALGKASSLSGAFIAGGYAAVALYSLPHIAASNPAQRFWTALAAAIAALCLCVAGYCLELACRVPPPDDDEKETLAA